MSTAVFTHDYQPGIRNRAILRVSLHLLSCFFRDGAHAYGVSGGLPHDARIIGVEVDQQRGEALLFVESDTATDNIPQRNEGDHLTTMVTTMHSLGVDGSFIRCSCHDRSEQQS